MTINLHGVLSRSRSECRDDDELAQAEGRGDDAFAQAGQIVLVGTADLLDEPVRAQALKHATHLSSRETRETTTHVSVLEAAEVELAAGQGQEEFQVLAVQQVKAWLKLVKAWLKPILFTLAPTGTGSPPRERGRPSRSRRLSEQYCG